MTLLLRISLWVGLIVMILRTGRGADICKSEGYDITPTSDLDPLISELTLNLTQVSYV